MQKISKCKVDDKNQKDLVKCSNKEKGAITLFVLVTCLFFAFILIALYISNTNKLQTQEKLVKQIQDNYANNLDDVYESEEEIPESDLPWIWEVNADGNVEITGIDFTNVVTDKREENTKPDEGLYDLYEDLYKDEDEDEEEDDWDIGQDQYYSGYKANFETLKTPQYIDGKKVVKFSFRDSVLNRAQTSTNIYGIKRIIFSEGLEEVGNDFWNRNSGGVEEIGFSINYSAFSLEFPTLMEVKFPKSLKKIGNRICAGANGLKSVVIPPNVTEIGNSAFIDCGLTSIIIPESVIKIGDRVFEGCSSLTTINIPQNVKNVGKGIFAKCTNLEEIVVDNRNSVYDSRANCNAIVEKNTNIITNTCKNTNIIDGIIEIGEYAFYGQSGATEIKFPKSIKKIQRRAFFEYNKLKKVEFNEGLEEIGDHAFSGGYKFSLGFGSATLPSTIKSIGSSVFSNDYRTFDLFFAEGTTSLNFDLIKDKRYIMHIPSSVHTITGIIGSDGYPSGTLNFSNGKHPALTIPENRWNAAKIIIQGVEV
ncbi:MAG: leucine-rich repeat domain-containing protein [Clostridia bacterium]|nr:leucine-rich repeat domain-containing protein [Clostridia bacterium]